MDRCNLTVLTTGVTDLPEFFAATRSKSSRRCRITARPAPTPSAATGSMKSIDALKRLNDVGYGDGRSGLRLVLVTNPVGAYLPPPQASLEAEWKRELLRLHGVRFDALYTITNMPISRYLEWLDESGNLERYMQRLVEAFNPATVNGVMCRSMISVGWDGRLYDCDFNQMLDLECTRQRLGTFATSIEALEDRAIVVDRHCFGCTAGGGSSCGGSIK
jgi:radical SAM/Cys-rich protein